MTNSSAKENILKKIRKALTHSTPIPFPASEGNNSLFVPAKQELEVEFAEQFTRLQGKFVFCADEKEMVTQFAFLAQHHKWTKLYCRETKFNQLLKPVFTENLKAEDLAGCEVAITGCELLVARTGSLLLSAAQQSGRSVSVYAPIHICIAYIDQLVYDIKDGLQQLKKKYAGKLPSLITLASGPSRTADIEKTLVVGVHGPKEVYVFLIDEKSGVK